MQWHQYDRNIEEPGYEDFEAVKQNIPDGHLCSANDPKLHGMDFGSADWKKTTVQLEGGKFQLRYLADVKHNPSYFEIYLSRPGYSATEPLKWSDLVKIADVPD